MADSDSEQVGVPPPLSAKHKDSFAYATIKNRLPVILTKVIDSVYRSKNVISETRGEEAAAELKDVVGRLSKLRNEVQTDKAVVEVADQGHDVGLWNAYLREQTEAAGEPPSWFKSAWLYVECYMYRRIQSAVLETTNLKDLDVFKVQKDEGLEASSDAVQTLLNHLWEICDNYENQVDTRAIFMQLLEVNLWGNKCDLSISAGVENHQSSSPLKQLEEMRKFILVDNKESVWRALKEAGAKKPGSLRVDIVLDNAGFELLTDLCLAEFLLTSGLAQVIHFHGKSMPWFVSDVTQKDFHDTLAFLKASSIETFSKTGATWQRRMSNESFVYKDHPFWTLPHDYSEMKTVAPDLYAELGRSDLILFKGDLNYRKLVSDRQWPVTTPFEHALRGFHPAPLCTLRTLKADVVTGLQPETVKVTEGDTDWMVNGRWAVVQFCAQQVPL